MGDTRNRASTTASPTAPVPADGRGNGAKSGTGDVVLRHRFAARTSEGQRRQLDNLRPSAATKSGVDSPAKLRPIRMAVLDELLREFGGSVRHDWLELLAARRARVIALQDYIDLVGVVKHRKHGSIYPAVERVAREEAGCAALLKDIEAMHREAGSTPGERLAAIEARIVAEREQAKPATRPELTPAAALDGSAQDGSGGEEGDDE